MPQSLAQIYLHLVFSTKNRAPILRPEIRDPLQGFFHGVLETVESPMIVAKCMADHAHILYCQSKNIAPMKVVEEVKRGSSIWIKKQDAHYQQFQWQRGYGMFSVSSTHLPNVIGYINHQETHHRKTSFQDELRKMFQESGMEYDERFVWD